MLYLKRTLSISLFNAISGACSIREYTLQQCTTPMNSRSVYSFVNAEPMLNGYGPVNIKSLPVEGSLA